MSTEVQVVPSNLQLPAHLQSPDIAAAIAAANAAAAGGVRAGGFPTISIKANKFSIKDGDETTPLMNPPTAPGQPALPMMCLEVVIVDANPALSHTFFAGEYVEGENKEPDCRSANGITPDADVATKQNAVCATCPQYQWGSKTSKLSGKPIRACGDSKQLAVIPAADLNYKMLGLQIKAGSLGNWGKYIQALTGRGYGVSTLVTNITFDQSANGVLNFSFNRFLTEAEYNKVNERKNGDDVRLIVAQTRALAPAVAQIAAPASAPALVAPAESAAPAQPAPATTGFGAAPQPVAPAPTSPAQEAPVAAAPAAATPVATGPTAADPFAGQPPHVKAAIDALGGLNTPAGMTTYKALTGIDYMDLVKAAPGAAAPNPFEGQPAHVEAAVTAAGGMGTAAGNATYKALTGKDAPGEPPKRNRRPRTPAATPAEPAAPVQPATPAPTAPVAATTGFGAAPAVQVQQPTAQTVASGASLAEKLRAKLAGAGAA